MAKKTETGFETKSSTFSMQVEKRGDKYFGAIQKNTIKVELEHRDIRVLFREIGIYLRQLGEIKPQSRKEK